MSLSRIEVTLAPGHPSLKVDGVPVDVSKVSRITVDAQGQEVPRVYLEAPVEGTVVLEGIVVERVPEPVSVNASEILKSFLSKLDPATFEQAILAQFDGLDDMTTGQAALNVLIGYADGHVTRS